jgi:glycosyltransferase involved in cell wall biosynthesis
VAYNAEKTIESVCERIPHAIFETANTEILIIDDFSTDNTFERAQNIELDVGGRKLKPLSLRNPVNLGYGGNQKVGYRYAIENNFDYVALVHGDGQYAPEMLPELYGGFEQDDADVVFGSRMLVKGEALKGNMPFYKYAGNKILTTFQNKILGLSLSEFHTGYRLYSIAALKEIPFHLNTNDFHFDTEIIIQLSLSKQKIVEKHIPTFYGEEVCHVNGMQYAWDVVQASFTAYMMNLSLLYDLKYDCKKESSEHYEEKLDFDSTHSRVLAAVSGCKNVLDIGCGPGHVLSEIRSSDVHVTGVDQHSPMLELDNFLQADLDDGLPVGLDYSKFDAILMLDVIEHLKDPEQFMLDLHESGLRAGTKIIMTTGNIGFLMSRITHLFGAFNYGKRGILDITHHRLFTISSLKKLVRQTNFDVNDAHGIPVPYALVFGSNFFSTALSRLNSLACRVHKGLFSFQFMLILESRPSLTTLLDDALRSQDGIGVGNDKERLDV